MKINRQTIPLNKEVPFGGDIDFSNAKFDPLFLRGIASCHIEGTAFQTDKILRLTINIIAKVIAISAYTLKDVPFTIRVSDELVFSDDQEDDTAIYEEKNIFDVDDYVLGIILSHIPNKVVGKGEKLPPSGEGYRIMTEEEYLQEKEKKPDPRWEKLDSVKIK
mgnify:FL=1